MLAVIYSLFSAPDYAAEIIIQFDDEISGILDTTAALDILARQAQELSGISRLLKKDRSGEFRVADRGQELAGTVSTGSVRYRKAALWRGQVRGSRSRRGLREQFGQPDEIIGGHSEGELPIDLG